MRTVRYHAPEGFNKFPRHTHTYVFLLLSPSHTIRLSICKHVPSIIQTILIYIMTPFHVVRGAVTHLSSITSKQETPFLT